MLDRYNNQPGSTGWNQINDTWAYLGNVNGLHMYVKIVQGWPMPDVYGSPDYIHGISYKQVMDRFDKERQEQQ